MSVRKRPWTTPKGEERSAWVCEYTDAGGKRRRKTFRLKKEADAFDARTAVAVRDGTHIADSASATVEEAGKLWLATAKAAGLERATVEDYDRHLRLHIVPKIGATRLSSLTIAKVRAFEDELRNDGRSPAMVRKVLVSMGSLVADAQERGLVARNVVRDMRARRGSGERRQDQRQKGRLKVGVDIPTREEVKALLTVLKGRTRPLILVAAFCGLRASELRGLRWQDIDLDKGRVRVHQRADRYADIGRPKSLSGERTVPAPPMVVNALKEWKLACPRSDAGLVFPNGVGKVEALNNLLRRDVHPAWVRAGVAVDTGEVDEKGNVILAPRYTGLHCLRHWFASWCINRREDGGLGLPPKSVQERMGHSTIALTMDRYSHLFPRENEADEMADAERAFLA
ncbi:integrase [Aureimonas altamirensis]|uniref:Integrase n=1 Tax=Aureimonas altamirensis TaxID=370622 RepID=A0A0B1Q2S5_9HYPH|nr:site-specific integrase [Aureimonas altamirensis]KHJ55138.1 integrase [Aureimonas altamirensis]